MFIGSKNKAFMGGSGINIVRKQVQVHKQPVLDCCLPEQAEKASHSKLSSEPRRTERSKYISF